MSDGQKINTSYRIDNPEEFAENLVKLFEESSHILHAMLDRPDSKNGAYSAASEVNAATEVMTELAQRWISNPTKLAEAQTKLAAGYIDLWSTTLLRLMGENVPDVAEPSSSDNRFKDPEWTSNPYFDFWKQAYLLTTGWAEELLAETDGLDEHERHKAEFYLRQVSSALSPSNFPMTNPEVVRETFSTNAKNLLTGMELLAKDMEKSGDLLTISQTDTEAFEVGKNLANTPGKVVFQNDLLQLIQYTPTTKKVHEIPLLVVPPWINKFYILDLTPPKSFLRYAVAQGFTVFVVSWVNPDEALAHKTFEDYMLEGVLGATDAIKRELEVEKVNILGYCVGGTLVGSTLAYEAARGEHDFASATFLTSQFDFTKAGDLLLFTTEGQLSSIAEIMEERGYLDGSRMANVFNMMRPRDLIWPYIVNNYLLGKKPFPFDLLYWNQDSTRMTRANHNFYLREFYHNNRLSQGKMSMGGVTLDLSKIDIPVFDLATKEDHIAPAPSVYIGAKLLKNADVEFVLSGSGHIAGVINPPEKMKYQYWTAETDNLKHENIEQWAEHAKEHAGSWWPYWSEWLAKQSGELTDAREPGARNGVIEDAPGSFVRARK